MENDLVVVIVAIVAAALESLKRQENMQQHNSILEGNMKYWEIVNHWNSAYLFNHCGMTKKVFQLLLWPCRWILIENPPERIQLWSLGEQLPWKSIRQNPPWFPVKYNNNSRPRGHTHTFTSHWNRFCCNQRNAPSRDTYFESNKYVY